MERDGKQRTERKYNEEKYLIGTLRAWEKIGEKRTTSVRLKIL
jgi:hypothetical protein